MVRLPVPEGTRAKDVSMQLSSKRIKLTLASGGSSSGSGSSSVLLEGELRGKVDVDGSYWSVEDLPKGCKPTRPGDAADVPGTGSSSSSDEGVGSTDSSSSSSSSNSSDSIPLPRFGDGGGRAVVLTMEKKEGGEFDPEEWMGVVLDAREAKAQVVYELPEREEFDVNEYIDSMGGYDESLVDKTMFSDISKSLAADLMKSGLLQDGDANMTDTNMTELFPDTEAQVVEHRPTEVATGGRASPQSSDAPRTDDVPPVDGPAGAAGSAAGAAGNAVGGLTVAALKAALAAHGLPRSGSKAELVRRLVAAQLKNAVRLGGEAAGAPDKGSPEATSKVKPE
jgi:hypothetical protein